MMDGGYGMRTVELDGDARVGRDGALPVCFRYVRACVRWVGYNVRGERKREGVTVVAGELGRVGMVRWEGTVGGLLCMVSVG